MLKGRFYIEDRSDYCVTKIKHDDQGYYIDFSFESGEKYEEYRRMLASKGIKIVATYLF